MLTTLLFNLFASLIAVSVSGTIVLHDTRLDKAFISTVSPASDTTVHDFNREVSSDQHVHNHESVSNSSDPILANRSHKKYITLATERLRLSPYLN